MLAATWSPDGRRLAALGTDDPRVILPWQSRVFVLEPGEASGANHRRLRVAGRRLPARADAGHSLDGRRRRSLPWGLPRREFLVQASTTGGETRRVWGGGSQIGDLSIDAAADRAVGSSRCRRTQPETCTASTSIPGSSEQITCYNREYFEDARWGRMEKFSLDRGGWRSSPASCFRRTSTCRAGTRWCWTFTVGPRAPSSTPFNPIQQVLATAGYIVLAVNPRGLQRLRHRLREGGARGLGRRGLPRHHGGRRRDVGPAVCRRDATGSHGLQLRRLHDVVDHRARDALRGGGRRSARHRPDEHVRDLRHRCQLRRDRMGRDPDGGADQVPGDVADQLRPPT